MGPAERRKHIDKVLPPFGQPWAPLGRCATMWLILAEALDGEHDATGAVLVNELTEHGTVRALKLRWRGRPTATRRWEYALCVIAWRLNGRQVNRKRGRDFLIRRVRG